MNRGPWLLAVTAPLFLAARCPQQDGTSATCDGRPSQTWFEDADGDGYGDEFAASRDACDPPVGFVANADDCDDARASVHPGAKEVCNALDDDCNGAVDEEDVAALAVRCVIDADGDRWGGTGTITACGSCPPGTAYLDGDCNDGDASIHPGARDLEGDGIDSDCDELDCTTSVDGLTNRYLCSHSGTAVDAFGACASELGGYPLKLGTGDLGRVVDQMDRTGQTFVLLGATDAVTEGVWVWADGSPATLEWAPGEPNDSNGDEDCSAIQGDLGFLVNDVPCASFAFTGITYGCDRPVPTDVLAWDGLDHVERNGCVVTWHMTGEPIAVPADCVDCAFAFHVRGEVVERDGEGADCDDLAQPYETDLAYAALLDGLDEPSHTVLLRDDEGDFASVAKPYVQIAPSITDPAGTSLDSTDEEAERIMEGRVSRP